MTLFRELSATDSTQVPFRLALVDLYRQGATVSATQLIASGASHSVAVYDTGALVATDAVMVGASGPTVTVSSIDNPTQVTIANSSGSSITFNVGDRLIPTSNRPIAYQDPFGTTSLGSTFSADPEGRIHCFINQKRFDYVLAPGTVALDAESHSTYAGTGPSMTWNHAVGGADRVVLVAIAWQEETESETLTSVTYGGNSMTHLGTANMVDLYSLVNPPLGTQPIVATWSGTNNKGVVSGAVSVVGVDSNSPLGTAYAASLTTTAPTVAVSSTSAKGLVFGAVAVNTVLSTITLSTSQTQKWNASAGTAGSLTRTQGGGATAPGTGSTVNMSWSFTGSAKPWGMTAVEARPVALSARVVIDAEGSPFTQSPSYVNALEFPSLQAAVDALGNDGGVVYIPGGIYNSTTLPSFSGTLTLPVGVHVHLLGDGALRTLLQATDISDADLLHIQGPQIVEGLTLDGYARTTSSTLNGRGIVVGVDHGGIDGAQVRDCSIQGSAGWSLYIKDRESPSDGLALMCTYSRIRIYGNRARGAIYIGTDNTTQHFDNCYVQPFTGLGLRFLGAGASFVDCTFEGPDSVSDSGTPSFVYVRGTSLRLQHCWFEDHYTGYSGANHPNYFITTASVSDVQPAHNLQVVGCMFARDTSNEGRLVYVGLGAKSVIIAGCDAGVQVHQPCPTAPSDAPHITIEPPNGIVSSEVSIIGCAVRDYCQYIPLNVDDGSNVMGQTIGISTTPLAGPPLAGVYRITAILVCTLGDPDTATVTVGWTNEVGAQTFPIIDGASLDVPHEWSGECQIHAVSGPDGVPITYSVTKAGTRAEYNLYMRAERVL